MGISRHSFRLFFGLVLFFFFFFYPSIPLLLQAQAAPMAYAPNQWTNSISIDRNGYPNGYVRNILLRNNHVASNPSVACGFICTEPCNVFLFAIFFLETGSGGINYLAYPRTVWSANQYNPVGENATVRFTNGNLALHDANGTSVWSTGIYGSSAIGINITEAGNLVLFNRNNKTVWQSWDHPVNALFLGQELREGQKLRRDQFYAAVLDDGLYVFVDTKPPQITCFRRSGRVTSSNGNSYIKYTNSSLMLYTSDKESVQLTPLVTAMSAFQYMSLEGDGRMRFFDWSSKWDITGDVFDGSGCFNPFVCGVYGVYSNGKCTCPGTDSGKGSYFEYIDAGKPELGCSLVTRLDCGATQDHQFLNLMEVAYFSYIDVQEAATFNGTDERSCVQACLRNCSCKAALFMYYQNASDGYCFLPSQLFSVETNNSTESGYHSNAHVKVQIARESSAPSPSPSPNTALMAEPMKKSTNLGLVLGFVIGSLSFLLFVGVLISVLIRRRKQDSRKAFRKEVPADEQEEQFEEISGMPTRFSFEQLELATDNFSKKIGEGGLGSVFMGELNRDIIAVKLLSDINQGRKEFLAEVHTIGKTHHFNLVRLIGFCAEKSHRMLVYEYMPNGSLDRWIFNEDRRTALSWQMRCKIIADIAKGLSYLHEECPQRIAHLDIKPQNILLDDKFNAKVSDFGLAKLIERDQTHVMTMMRGTPGYLAPEWLTSFITEKVDVYSFGVMVLEIVCRRRNLDPSQPPEQAHLVRLLQDKIKMDRLLDLVCGDGIGTTADQDEAIQMMKLATWCLNHDPDRRPSMSTVVKVLEGVVKVETGVESSFIASIPTMQSQAYDGLFTSSSCYASSASPPQSAPLLSGAR